LGSVNKNELKCALKLGFKGDHLIFNGNGKTLSEIDLAIKSGCYLNIDSLFNLIDTIKICQKLNSKQKYQSNMLPVKLIVRINQSISAKVHQYLDTSVKSCKFGVIEDDVEKIIEIIKSNDKIVKLAGFHAHLGSTIETTDVYERSVQNLISLINTTKEKYKLNSIELINLGGGLGINYKAFYNRTTSSSDEENNRSTLSMPTPKDLAAVIAKYVHELSNIKIVVEPGRSLVGNSSIILTKLLGVKRSKYKSFLVCDASMCECIRPCLYSAYHHIDYISDLVKSNDYIEKDWVDIVGPVCESGDFLGKNRYMPLPGEEQNEPIYMAIMDTGAYCSAMASNYNLHPRPAEVLIDEQVNNENMPITKYYLMKKSEDLNDILKCYYDYNGYN
jgi:diaminopimelate decarboxylase